MAESRPDITTVTVASTDRLKLVIELFSVAAGLSFVLSAIIQALYFRLAWNLSYFQIASPNDVIMGSFSAMFFALPLVAIGYVSGRIIVTRIFGERVKPYAQTFALAAVVIGFVWLTYRAVTPYSVSPSAIPSGLWRGLTIKSSLGEMDGCSEAPVLWIGSSSAVLNCQGRVTVLHNLEGVVTERVR